MCFSPVSASASIRRTFSATGIIFFSDWKPSRGPSSPMITRLGRSDMSELLRRSGLFFLNASSRAFLMLGSAMRTSRTAVAISRPRLIGRCDEDRRIATREQHGAPEILLHLRPEHQPQQERCALAAEADEDVAQHAEQRDLLDMEGAVLQAVGADAQNSRIAGERKRYGTVSSFTHMPIIGRLMTTSIRLPTHIEAIMPQNRSGFLVMTSGPGWMPWMIMAPTISAMTALDGIPSVSIGMNDVWAAALLADSGAATPSTAPLPNPRGAWRSSSPACRPRKRRGSGRRRAARPGRRRGTCRGYGRDGRRVSSRVGHSDVTLIAPERDIFVRG